MFNQVVVTVQSQDTGWDSELALENPGVPIEELVKMLHKRAVSHRLWRKAVKLDTIPLFYPNHFF